MQIKRFVSFVLMGILLTGCAHHLSQGKAFRVTKVSYNDLPGWRADHIEEALPALLRSCEQPSDYWRSFCNGLKKIQNDNPKKVRAYVEKKLKPYQVTSYGSPYGTITGYYEAELTGSRYKIKQNQVPIRGVPPHYTPNEKIDSRAEIEGNHDFAPIIAWADSPVDKFILQVQGSGRMKTPDGEIRLGYAGNNGHTFVGLGKIMSEAGVLEPGKGSMPDMRQWLIKNPEKAKELMAQNPRYIFFKEILGDTPYGSAGVVLTPERSVAVDNSFIPMHTPMFLSTTDAEGKPINKLVVAQDIGNAIRGGVRADYFWGHGEHAFNEAGRMKSRGRYFLLLPD